MEEQCNDPYEQQLFAVFESCLVDGQTDLKEEGLKSLCEKLQLDDAGKDMILSLLHKNVSQKSLSFRDFRNGLLELLDKSQEKPPSPDKGQQIISDADSKQHCYRSINDNKIATMKFQRQQIGEYINDRIFDGRNDEFWNNHSTNNAVNGSDEFPVYRYSKVSAMAEQENSHGDQLNSVWSGNSQSNLIEIDGVKCGSQHAGFMQSNSIVDMWEMAGIQNASTLLSDLGFEMQHVSMNDLINVLLDELKSHHEEPRDKVVATHIKLLKCTLCLFQEQNRHLTNLMEHLSFERDKLRTDVMEANERANSLAQEIDEHHTRMEKCRQEQLKQLESKHAEIIKELMNQLNMEREKSSSAIQALDRQLQNSQLEEQRIKSELTNMSRETRELETENHILSNEIAKLKSFNDQLSVQVERLAVQQDEVTNTETEESEQIVDLLNHVKHLKSEIAMLRDHNDELTAELEYYKRNEKESKIFREISCVTSAMPRSLSDYNDEDSCSSSNHIDIVNNTENQSDQSKNIPNTHDVPPFEPSLNGVRLAIVEAVQQLRSLAKQQPCSNHCALNLKLLTILNNLESQLPFLRDQDPSTDLEPMNPSSKSLEKLRLTMNSERSQSEDPKSNPQKNKSSGLRDYPPRKEDQAVSGSKTDLVRGFLQLVSDKGKEAEGQNERWLDMKTIDEFLREREIKLVSEKKQVLERCAELEKSLDLLKMEYEQCEDYWTAKLEEEREIFEQEQKISDDKFAELFNKMTEYEEQYSAGDKARSEGRLTPIEEKVNLEQQYADLEDEFDKWKLQTQEEIDFRDKQITELQGKLDSRNPQTDVAVQCPEDAEMNSQSVQDSSTPFSYHSLDSTGTFELPSTADFVDGGFRESDEKKRSDSVRGAKFRREASEGSDQMDTDISFDDVRWLIKKKTDIGFECKALQKQREKLRQEVAQLQNLKELNDYRMVNSVVDVGTLQALYLRIHAQEQRQKDLMACIRHQQQDTMRLLQQTWKQHHNEITDLKLIIHGSKEQLEQQILINKEQAERLVRADQLTKELYMENTQLLESIKRLEQHFHILSQCNTECTSV